MNERLFFIYSFKLEGIKTTGKDAFFFLSGFLSKEKLDQFFSIFLFYLWKYGTTHFTIKLMELILFFLFQLL